MSLTGPTRPDDDLPNEASTASPIGDMTLNASGEAMLADLALSPLTVRTYRHGLNALVRCLHALAGDDQAADEFAPLPLDRISEDTLADYSRWLREAYPDPRAGRDASQAAISRTARTYLVAARRLMNWLDLNDLLPEGVSYDRMVRRIDRARGQRRQGYRQRRADPETVKVLTHYLRRPLPASRRDRMALLRNRALMALLYDTGTRISEALALTREDVLDGRANKVRLSETKNGKPRTVFLSAETQRLLREYVREREDGPFAPLFVSHGRGAGQSITPGHAWLLVKQAAKAEALYDSTSPHSLRHRRAQDLLDEGMPLEWVAALLGHQHPDTTRVVYAWETNEERLADMVATYGASLDQEIRRNRHTDGDDDDQASSDD